MKYKNIIFDLDNTILDFDYAEEHALKNLLNDYNIEYNEENLKIYRSVNRPLWRKLEKGEITRDELFSTRFPIFFSKFNIKTNGNLELIYRSYLAKYGTIFIPHADEVLHKLKNSGYNLYLATNGFSDTQISRIKNSGLNNIFDDIFISEDIGYDKPNINFYKYIEQKLKIKDKSSFLMIGDNESSDIKGAINFGIDSILFNHKNSFTNSSATFIIDDLEEIYNILGV